MLSTAPPGTPRLDPDPERDAQTLVGSAGLSFCIYFENHFLCFPRFSSEPRGRLRARPLCLFPLLIFPLARTPWNSAFPVRLGYTSYFSTQRRLGTRSTKKSGPLCLPWTRLQHGLRGASDPVHPESRIAPGRTQGGAPARGPPGAAQRAASPRKRAAGPRSVPGWMQTPPRGDCRVSAGSLNNGFPGRPLPSALLKSVLPDAAARVICA